MRNAIERAVPHGRGGHGGKGAKGSWDAIPNRVVKVWAELEPGFKRIADKHPEVERSNHVVHLGTLGTGNHFIEVCLDEQDHVWFMLHSGSRGVGNRIGSHFIALAKQDMSRHIHNLPDANLAYFSEGSPHFDDYVEAVSWAQHYARQNRELMMHAVLAAVRRLRTIPPFQIAEQAVNCHHNYVCREEHYGKSVLVTRKGAVRAGKDELGIIPGSMGAKSYIVRGKGDADSFSSCAHGAGRRMSRTEAKRRFSRADLERQTEGVECRKDPGVIDEIPGAYKSIDEVMANQTDLVEVVHTLKQVVCVKG
jgi:tRNA-splicing ligase RtcB